MRCSKVTDSLMEYLSDELSGDLADRIREHLANCESCRARVGPARRALNALTLLAEDDPAPSLLDGVKARLIDQETARRNQLRLRSALVFAMPLLGGPLSVWLWHVAALHPAAQLSPGKKVVRRHIGQPGGRPLRLAVLGPSAADEEDAGALPTAKHKTKPAPRWHRPNTRRLRLAQRVTVDFASAANPVPTKTGPRGSFRSGDGQSPPACSQSAMMFGLHPRQPEFFLIQVGGGRETKPAEIAIKRDFDLAGNIISVTIHMVELPYHRIQEPAQRLASRRTFVPATSRLTISIRKKRITMYRLCTLILILSLALFQFTALAAEQATSGLTAGEPTQQPAAGYAGTVQQSWQQRLDSFRAWVGGLPGVAGQNVGLARQDRRHRRER